jgi:hypothetical protein
MKKVKFLTPDFLTPDFLIPDFSAISNFNFATSSLATWQLTSIATHIFRLSDPRLQTSKKYKSYQLAHGSSNQQKVQKLPADKYIFDRCKIKNENSKIPNFKFCNFPGNFSGNFKSQNSHLETRILKLAS